MSRRKPIPKQVRRLVYEKYAGHCAYCGKEIKYEEMQVDHAVAFAQSWYGTEKERQEAEQMVTDGSIDDIKNLMPACRPCNFYKGGGGIESLRRKIMGELEHTCRDTFQARLAMQYGMLTYNVWDGKFYFERV